MAQGVPGRLSPRIFFTFGTTMVVGRQPYTPAAFIPGEIPGTHFQRLSRPQDTCFCRKEPRKKSPLTPQGIDPSTIRLVAQLPQAPLYICIPIFIYYDISELHVRHTVSINIKYYIVLVNLHSLLSSAYKRSASRCRRIIPEESLSPVHFKVFRAQLFRLQFSGLCHHLIL